MTKILLVEDDKNLREIYGTRLYAEGYDIVSAGDGEAALAMAIKERPDLIISDVMMPKISGFDMLDILRSTTETKDIPVIMMTALSSEDQQARGEALGANRYLVKSQVGIEDVVRTVHEVLQDTPGMQPSTPAQAPVAPAPRTDTNNVTVPTRPPATQQPQPAPATQMSAQPAAPQQQPPQAQPPAPQTTPPEVGELANDGSLPRPIAPFSTQRPTGLGDRVIHPIDRTSETQTSDDVASKMAAELSADAPLPQQQQPVQAQSTTPQQPQPQPQVQQQPQPQQTTQPQQQPTVQAQQPPTAQQ